MVRVYDSLRLQVLDLVVHHPVDGFHPSAIFLEGGF